MMQTTREMSDASSRPTQQTTHAPEDLTTDEVRQGATGHNVRYVLMIALIGALIAMTAAWLWVD
jgi:hypothetical protein